MNKYILFIFFCNRNLDYFYLCKYNYTEQMIKSDKYLKKKYLKFYPWYKNWFRSFEIGWNAVILKSLRVIQFVIKCFVCNLRLKFYI